MDADGQLPSRAVTFLFTDIEGSTGLIEELGEEGYVEALAEHRRVLRTAFGAHSGVEVDTQGDAFLFAFADPGDALAGAAEGQRALAAGPVSVRIGLHTGDARLTGEGYAGRELHRAARIAACGHGGQVVVSATTRSLVDGELVELGEHRLKDFAEPVALFQLGDERFPPLKTISNTNLPRPASSFVGREREQAELVSMLANGTRLLTLSGPGGTGKTRLAIEAAAELVPAFKAGVFWVPLAPLRDPALVTETIGQTLGAKNGLADHIAERELLLLLDNLEQVVEAAPELGELLEACPNLKLLVTSRELLRIGGEVDYPVPPLAEPEAVELFCERSRLEPEESIPQLCRCLDELPLAIELAAARTSVLSPTQILERISQRLDLFKGDRDADARQQTLRATIEWSHDLLDEDEQRLFRRLAVFRGGCTLDAAEQVADADLDTLQSLVDKSLLRHGGERFTMLETIRQYAHEQLAASGEEADLRRAHARFILDFAEATDDELQEGGDQAELLARIAGNYDNLRAALEWARDTGEDEILLRLAAAADGYWRTRGLLHREARPWLTLALERALSPPEARMKVLSMFCGVALWRDRDYDQAELLAAEWRGIAERTGNDSQVLRALNTAALIAEARGCDFDEVRTRFVEVREAAERIGDRSMVAVATVNLAGATLESGDVPAALDFATEAVELFRELGDDGGVAVALDICGLSALRLSEPVRAETFYREAIVITGRVGAVGLIADHGPGLAAALIAQHEDERGAELLGAAASLREELERDFDNEVMEQLHDQAVADARAALGEEAFAAAWARGQAMTPEEIVAFGAEPAPGSDALPDEACGP